MLFKKVVTLRDGIVTVDTIRSRWGSTTDPKTYAEDKMPKRIRAKLALLMYLPENDNEGIDGVGIRVGSNIFWIT